MATWKKKEAAIRALEHNGKVDPKALIEAARDPEHPCHDGFTWDVDKAADERWHTQARALIRAVHFEVIVEDVGSGHVPHYVNDPGTAMFRSLPKCRSTTKVSAVFAAEINQLYGHARRAYGIGLAKVGIIGEETVLELRGVCDTLAAMRESL